MTIGISPKVLIPSLLQFVAILVSFIESGTFDRTEFAQAVGLALTATIGYLASPGEVKTAIGVPNDASFSPEARGKLGLGK